eukprot:366539-Chlamydomonas_euryale.AAC.11
MAVGGGRNDGCSSHNVGVSWSGVERDCGLGGRKVKFTRGQPARQAVPVVYRLNPKTLPKP